MTRNVRGNDGVLASLPPRERDEIVVRRVSRAVHAEQLPRAIMKQSLLRRPKDAVIEIADLDAGLFIGPATQLHRRLGLRPVELPVVVEPHPRCRERDSNRRLQPAPERRSRASLIVVFEKSRELRAERWIGLQMPSHVAG